MGVVVVHHCPLEMTGGRRRCRWTMLGWGCHRPLATTWGGVPSSLDNAGAGVVDGGVIKAGARGRWLLLLLSVVSVVTDRELLTCHRRSQRCRVEHSDIGLHKIWSVCCAL